MIERERERGNDRARERERDRGSKGERECVCERERAREKGVPERARDSPRRRQIASALAADDSAEAERTLAQVREREEGKKGRGNVWQRTIQSVRQRARERVAEESKRILAQVVEG